MINPTQSIISEDNKVCHICKSRIDEFPCRFLIVKDKIFQKHKLLSFHYFFPCWDIDYVCQNLREYEIFKAGFHCDKSILKNPEALENMRKNGDLWDLEIIV